MLSENRKAIILLILLPLLLLAKDGEEKIFSFEDDTYHSTELSDLLENIRKNPYDINTVSQTDLEKLPWLSETDIEKIINYRKAEKISNWKEFIKTGINEITISDLKPYFSFEKSSPLKIKQISRVEFQQQNEHLPSCLKYFQKSLFQIKKFNFGFISQKDQGENDPLDFYSYFIEYSRNNFLERIILGKYRLAFGQGILFSPKLGMSKSAEATSTPSKKFKPIKPYTSSYEIWELEGAAFNIKMGKFNFIPFYSSTRLSANLDYEGKISSFNESGLHYDERKKDNVNETLFGAAINYTFSNNIFGFIYSQNEFDHQFQKPEWNNKYSTFGLNFILNKNSYPTFGELAFADDKFAGIIGTKWGEDKLKQLLLFRYYEKNFPTWHGHAFSAQSRFDNEKGFYYGITFLPFRRAKINFYFDIWKFPQTRYLEKMPTVGSEQFLQFELSSKTNNYRLTLKHRDKEKYKVVEEEGLIRDLEMTLLRIDWWQKISQIWLKTRCELKTEYLKNEKIHKKGILTYEQLKWKIEKLELIAQITAYHSDVLHYMYENSIDGIMQNSILTGDGIYSFFLVKYRIIRNSEIQFKVSDEWFKNDKMRLYFQMVTNF